jgi:hypothetical protein
MRRKMSGKWTGVFCLNLASKKHASPLRQGGGLPIEEPPRNTFLSTPTIRKILKGRRAALQHKLKVDALTTVPTELTEGVHARLDTPICLGALLRGDSREG